MQKSTSFSNIELLKINGAFLQFLSLFQKINRDFKGQKRKFHAIIQNTFCRFSDNTYASMPIKFKFHKQKH
jgi:hypothetical protein